MRLDFDEGRCLGTCSGQTAHLKSRDSPWIRLCSVHLLGQRPRTKRYMEVLDAPFRTVGLSDLHMARLGASGQILQHIQRPHHPSSSLRTKEMAGPVQL